MKDRWVGGFATWTTPRPPGMTPAQASKDVRRRHLPDHRQGSTWTSGWLEARRSQVRPTTLVSYHLHVNKYIVPRIGAERLQQLTPTMVDHLSATSRRRAARIGTSSKRAKSPKAQPLSATTVRHVGATLHKALADADQGKNSDPLQPRRRGPTAKGTARRGRRRAKIEDLDPRRAGHVPRPSVAI